MMLFRNVRTSDLEDLYLVAQESGIGMTTLPKERALLKQRIDWSIQSQQQKVNRPNHEYYFFVLEDPCTKKIVGTSAIEAQIGYDSPFYSYKVSRHTKISPTLGIKNNYQLLHLVNDKQGVSELCTLYLTPEYRKNNNGILLSKARFLFMAQHKHRFADTVIADLRGISNEQGLSPFWEHVGSHFFHMSFAEADRLTLATDKQFIADLLPCTPIHVSLLPKEAQAVIGTVHPSTRPAMNILLREGFRYNDYVDIFDAGPTIEAPLNSIKTIAQCHTMIVDTICDEVSQPACLLSHQQTEFQATIAPVICNDAKNTCSIDKKTAQLLQIDCGDQLQIARVS